MSLDIDDLLVKIKSAIDANVPLLVNKVTLGVVGEGLQRPYANVKIIDGRIDWFYSGSLNYVPIEFSVYSDTESQCNTLTKALLDLFHLSSLSLTGQTLLRAMKTVNPSVKQEGRVPKNRVYKGTVTVEFLIQV